MPTPDPSDRFIDVAGVRTRYRTLGDGPPVVLLHGISRALEDWEQNLPALASRHRVYALDVIGFGRTDKPDVPYSMPGLARFVRAFLDAVGETRPVALVGSSMGGAIALSLAGMAPERVERVVLVGGAGFGDGAALGLRLLTLPGVGETLARPGRSGVEQTLRSVFRDPRFVTPERVARDLDLAREPGAARAFLRVLRMMGTVRRIRPEWREEMLARLGGTRLPMLITWGRHDRILSVAHLEEARRRFPHARVHVFEASGHFPQIEEAEAFDRLVLDFLAGRAEDGVAA